MGCTSCEQRRKALLESMRRVAAPSQPVVVNPTSCPLSAAQLTQAGYVRTCTLCGAKTQPTPFPELCTVACPRK